ncbi:MAG: ATP-binding protein [Chloroflexota bacterium]
MPPTQDVGGPDIIAPDPLVFSAITALAAEREAILSQMTDGVIVCAPDGTVSFMNQAAVKLYGEDYTGRSLFNYGRSIVLRDDAAHTLPMAMLPLYKALTEGEATDRAEAQLLRDGETLILERSAAPILAEDGTRLGAVLAVRDNTDRKWREEQQAFLARAGEVLSSSLDYEATLTQVAQLAVPFLADFAEVHLLQPDGTLRSVALAHTGEFDSTLIQVYEEKFPPRRGTPYGTYSALESDDPVLLADIPPAFWEDVAAGNDEHLEFLRAFGMRSVMRIPLKSRGHTIGVLSFVSMRSGRSFGEPQLRLAMELARRSAVAVDNALLYRQAEQARQGAESQRAWLHDLFMQVPGAFCSTRGPDHAIALANPGFLDFVLGRDILNKPGREALPALAAQGIFDILDHVYASGQVFVANDMYIGVDQGDGELRETYFDVIVQPMHDSLGRIEGLLCHGVEVTDRVHARMRGELLERQKAEFLSSAAHDLRTPLTTIKGQAQTLARMAERESPVPVERLTVGLDSVERAATRMSRLIDELLDVTRAEMDTPLELRLRPVDLLELAREAVADAAQTGRHQSIVVRSSLDELVGVWDPERIDRVLDNLLSNAIKYSPPESEVEVTIRRDAVTALLEVRDTGIGIPAKDLPHVVERFYRAGNAGEGGTGIGLAAARRCIEQHGGTLTVESVEGKGTAVRVALPLSQLPPDRQT